MFAWQMNYRVYGKATRVLFVMLVVVLLCVLPPSLRPQQLANTATIDKDVAVLKISSIKRFVGLEGEEEISELEQLDCAAGMYPLLYCVKTNWRSHYMIIRES